MLVYLSLGFFIPLEIGSGFGDFFSYTIIVINDFDFKNLIFSFLCIIK